MGNQTYGIARGLALIFFFETSYNSIYCLPTIIHLSVKVAYNWLSAYLTIQQNYLTIQYSQQQQDTHTHTQN